MAIKIITKYDYANREKPGIDFKPLTNPADRSMTVQSDMDAADINKIMARYEKTGVLIDPLGVERKPVYGDFTEIKNYHEMLVGIRNVERAFGLLPADIRNRFDNDPQKLIDFVDNPANDAESIKMGLKEAPITAPSPDTAEEALRRIENKKESDKYAAPGAPVSPPPTAG